MKKNIIISCVKSISSSSRKKRANIFRQLFSINCNSKILDLGSEEGTNINRVLEGTEVDNNNVYIADINPAYNEGHSKFGYQPVHLHENEILPFDNGFFDIVFCSSVIEHVTVTKDKIWKLYSGKVFKKESLHRQKEFAQEISRVGKQYYVQTPYKYFPIESHTWMPLLGFFPRSLLINTLRFTNLFWIKKTSPDWNLLNKKQIQYLFPDAQIIKEKFCGMTKSIMAVRKMS